VAEFSPIGHLFSLGSFLKTAEAAQTFRLLIFTKKLCDMYFDKNGLGHILGGFFQSSSGHPM
jgi:hypothetical protein